MGKNGSKYLCDYYFMKGQNWSFSHPRDFFSTILCFRTPRQKGVRVSLFARSLPFSAVCQSIFVQPGLGNVECWGSGRWWWPQLFTESTRQAGPRNTCCRIPVLRNSSLGYLIFPRCLVLIKGICHVQWPLLSTAPGFPCVISLFKPCLRLCQVLTVALSTRV